MPEVVELWREQFSASLRSHMPPDFPEVVTLCGSTRFADAFRDALRDETLKGKIVLSVGLLGHAEGIDMAGPIKKELDELHFRKIEMSDCILVISKGGYVGHSTRNEIAHATKRGKIIRWLEESAKENYYALAKGEEAKRIDHSKDEGVAR